MDQLLAARDKRIESPFWTRLKIRMGLRGASPGKVQLALTVVTCKRLWLRKDRRILRLWH